MKDRLRNQTNQVHAGVSTLRADRHARTWEHLPDGRARLRGGGAKKGIVGGIVLLAFAAFWNGITWTAVLSMWSDDGSGMQWFFFAFMGIFVLIGLLMLLGGVSLVIKAVLVGRQIAAPTLTLDRLPLRLGERFDVLYEQPVRRACRIASVKLTLVCQEWVRYRVGTDTRTATHEALSVEQVALRDTHVHPGETITARAAFEIPRAGMHSFEGHNNRIKWFIRVHTDIANWPDYTDDVPIQVTPRLVHDAAPPTADRAVSCHPGPDRAAPLRANAPVTAAPSSAADAPPADAGVSWREAPRASGDDFR